MCSIIVSLEAYIVFHTEHDTKETRSKCKTHDDPEEDLYQCEANILHKREDEHQSGTIPAQYSHEDTPIIIPSI